MHRECRRWWPRPAETGRGLGRARCSAERPRQLQGVSKWPGRGVSCPSPVVMSFSSRGNAISRRGGGERVRLAHARGRIAARQIPRRGPLSSVLHLQAEHDLFRARLRGGEAGIVELRVRKTDFSVGTVEKVVHAEIRGLAGRAAQVTIEFLVADEGLNLPPGHLY